MSKNPLNSEKKQNIFVSSSQELKKSSRAGRMRHVCCAGNDS